MSTQITAGQVVAYGPETVKKGDAVKIRGRWREIVRANRKTVTVPSLIGSWTDTAPWHEVADHRTAEQVVDSHHLSHPARPPTGGRAQPRAGRRHIEPDDQARGSAPLQRR
jgi:hypothetical protein